MSDTSKPDTKAPKNSILSPAVGNDEEFKNLGGMPPTKSLDQIHADLKPSKIPAGVSPSKSRVM